QEIASTGVGTLKPYPANVFDTCIQINLQQGFGGGEVFTATLARALRRLGVDTLLFVDPHAEAWSSLPMQDIRVEPLADPADLPGLLRGKPRQVRRSEEHTPELQS